MRRYHRSNFIPHAISRQPEDTSPSNPQLKKPEHPFAKQDGNLSTERTKKYT
jgi:hypothetical protein